MGTLLNPVRVPYFDGVIRRELGPGDHSVLEIGCGGGLLLAALEEKGLRVAGVDPSRPSLAAAAGQVAGHLVAGIGERLPFAPSSFDAVILAEVLEHVADPAEVVDDACRVVRPGGVVAFAGPNRTALSKVVLIGAAQRWRMTRVLPTDLHEWDRFVRPAEVAAMLSGNGVEVRDVVGVGLPLRRLGAAVAAVTELRRGGIGHAEAGSRIELAPVRSQSIAFQGYGVRSG